jgi:mandelate racemase
MAAWDACARARGVSLATLLGGNSRPIPAYAILRTMAPGTAAEEAAEAVAHGFVGVKVKVGRGTLGEDLDAIRAVRAAIGSDAELMIDYNQSLSVDDALDRVRALDDEGVAWIEEPTRADDDRGHAAIAAAARTPIPIGENWWGPSDMEKSIAAGACDQVTLDVMKLGGVRGWLTAAALAADAALSASSHAFPALSVQLLALTPTCHRLEYLDHAARSSPSQFGSPADSPTRRSVRGAASSGTRRRSAAGPSADPAATAPFAVLLASGPAIRPGLDRRVYRQQLPSLIGQLVAPLAGLDDSGRAQLGEPIVEDRGADRAAAGLRLAERQRAVTQLPDHSQRPPPAQQIEQRHDRPAGVRAAGRFSRSGNPGQVPCALISEAVRSATPTSLLFPKHDRTGA